MTVKVDMHPLLGLQGVDSAADGLAAERAGLPQRAALVECERQQLRLAAAAEAARARAEVLSKEESDLERDVAAAVGEGKEVEDRLYSGKVKGVSELEGLQAQLHSVRARQAELEERQMSLMETREALDEEISACADEGVACQRRREDLLGSLAEAEAKIDAKLSEVAGAREAAVARVDAAALQMYERLRKSPRLAGVVTAQVGGNACGRCRIPVPVMHATRIRLGAAGDVVRCENCGRILVA